VVCLIALKHRFNLNVALAACVFPGSFWAQPCGDAGYGPRTRCAIGIKLLGRFD